MATKRITTLIEARDGFEILRDEIAAIIAVESAEQEVLAATAGKDPKLWRLRVYTERASPWAAFEPTSDDAPVDDTPVVNVWFDSANYDRTSGNVFSHQKTVGTFHIDCYGYAVATDLGTSHQPGDERAALAAQRAFRLVRNILMAAHWHKLGQPSFVWERWPASATAIQPQRDNAQAEHVWAMRLALEVTFNELAPQHEPVELELISTQVSRDGDGKILVTVDIPTPPLTP
jgi:hypothetical protein